MKQRKRVYEVTRTDNGAQLILPARSPEEAVRKAPRWHWMRGVKEANATYSVRMWCATPEERAAGL
jgi:hypothetical protein